MKMMAGIDLHSNNAMCAVMDIEGKRIKHRRLPCDLSSIAGFFEPYRDELDTIAVESTFNWYWLVDGLQDKNYKLALANPAAIKQYDGIKHSDDASDAYFLADLLRLGILPTGHIYERSSRSVRDLLRRRMMIVQLRTSLILSFKSLNERTLGEKVSQNLVKKMKPEEARKRFTEPADRLISGHQIGLIRELGSVIRQLENHVLSVTEKWTTYQRLQSMPGIGKILGLTIALETGDVTRFAGAGNFASYSRCVDSRRISNGKKKGENNRKCGNRYLGWAFVEAAHFSCRWDDQCKRFYERKRQKTNTSVATKALACKLAKAAWHVMSGDVDYDTERVFGSKKKQQFQEVRREPVQGLDMKSHKN